MQSVGVNLNFRVNAVLFECFLQRVLGERLALVIVLGDGNQ